MTASTNDLTNAPSRTPLVAALGVAAAAVLTAIGNFGTVNSSRGSKHDASDWLIDLGMTAVAAVVVYGLAVRGAAAGNPGRRALVLAVVGVPSVVVFWSGLPMVLVSASVACALTEKDRRGSYGTGSKIAFGLALLVTAAATNLAFVG